MQNLLEMALFSPRLRPLFFVRRAEIFEDLLHGRTKSILTKCVLTIGETAVSVSFTRAVGRYRSAIEAGCMERSKAVQIRLGQALWFLLILSVPIPLASAACHVVTPSGSGSKTGADWNNAYAGIPGTLTRGDIYYLADGTYPQLTLSQADSGTTAIEMRKAQPSDHCTATGWNTSTMGSSQAVFTRAVGITTDYWVMNGNGSQTAQGCGGAPGSTVTSSPPTPSDCGIKIDNTGCSGSTNACNDPIYIGNPNGQGVNNVTFKYVELVGNGDNNSDQFEIFAPFGSSNSVFTHIYAHNAGCVYFQDGLDSHTTSFSYFWGTEVNGATGGCHGQYMFDSGGDSNSVEHDNIYRDITGTAIWTFANYSTTHSNWQFYNNAIFNSSPAASWAPYLSDGVIACINAGTNCANFTFMQNTIVNINNPGINNENRGSYIVENNLYYNNPNPPSFNRGTGGSYTQDHNSCLNSGTCPSGTSNVTDVTAPDPFTNWTGSLFTLASESSDWNNRVSLNPPYTTDPNGTTRVTDRGVYQSQSNGTQPPTSPTNLSAIVN
jgi:hypothetical protein